jgi:hypothetical protein
MFSSRYCRQSKSEAHECLKLMPAIFGDFTALTARVTVTVEWFKTSALKTPRSTGLSDVRKEDQGILTLYSASEIPPIHQARCETLMSAFQSLSNTYYFTKPRHHQSSHNVIWPRSKIYQVLSKCDLICCMKIQENVNDLFRYVLVFAYMRVE